LREEFSGLTGLRINGVSSFNNFICCLQQFGPVGRFLRSEESSLFWTSEAVNEISIRFQDVADALRAAPILSERLN
jgi:hypothetical protein